MEHAIASVLLVAMGVTVYALIQWARREREEDEVDHLFEPIKPPTSDDDDELIVKKDEEERFVAAAERYGIATTDPRKMDAPPF
jgi:cell division septation protein DedD